MDCDFGGLELANVMYRRLQTQMELTGGAPSSHFAYRRQQSPQQAALLGRWLIAAWASTGATVCSINWDEQNAFCNLPRAQTPLLFQLCLPFSLLPSMVKALRVTVFFPLPPLLPPPGEGVHGM